MCLSFLAVAFQIFDIETSFFGMVVYLDNIWVRFESQGHWIKCEGHGEKNVHFPTGTSV